MCNNIKLYQIQRAGNSNKAICLFFERGFVPFGRDDLSPVKLKAPISWSEDIFSDRNWMFQLHGWRMLDAFFNRMEPLDIEFISSIMTDWWQFYSSDPSVTSWFWYDMSTGLRASKIAFLMAWCAEHDIELPLSNDVLCGLINEHIAHLTNIDELNFGNHGLFQLNGLLALVDAIKRTNFCKLGSGKLAHAKQFAVINMQKILTSQLGEHGVHTEDAPDYHFFALAKISQVLNAPWWQMDEMTTARDMLERAEYAKYWFVTPSLHCPPVGDSAEVIKLKSIDGLRFWPHEQSENSIAAHLDGYAVIRSTPATGLKESHYLFMQASFHSSGHKHCDCLSFVWQEGNRYRLFDSGKYGYQRDAMRAYFQSTRAHNTLEVDKKDFSRQKKDAYGSAIQTVENVCGYWLVAGCVNHKALGVIHQRVLIYKPGVGVDVLDRVINQTVKQRTYRFHWHLGETASVDDRAAVDSVVSISVNGELDTQLSTTSSLSSKAEYTVHKGEDEPRLQGWISREYLKFQPSTTLEVRFDVEDKEFLALSNWRLATATKEPYAVKLAERQVAADDTVLQERIHELFASVTH